MLRALLIALALLAVSAAPASATIVPGKGMAGVKMGDCADKVRAKLGQPERTFRTDDFAGPVIIMQYRARGLKLTFHFGGSCQALTSIFTAKGRERTAEGVGKGTQLRTLRAKLSGEHCMRSHGRVRSCHLGSFRPGRVVTDFRIDSKGRVSNALVGRVLD